MEENTTTTTKQAFTHTPELNTTALAYMGDAVYEVYVRKHVIAKGSTHTDVLHKQAIKYVKASGQAKAIKALIKGREDFSLSEAEQSLVRRAKNHKIGTKAKNATVMDYKWATAFEALIGSLYLTGDTDRLEKIIDLAIEIIEGE